MNTLVLTIGLPRSGKSTWSRTQTVPIVNPDSIRLALHGKVYEPLAEPFVWAIARVMVRSLFLAGHNTVILDATNARCHRVNEWRSSAWAIRCEYFPTSRAECIRRALVDNNTALVPVIERMSSAWDHTVLLDSDLTEPQTQAT